MKVIEKVENSASKFFAVYVKILTSIPKLRNNLLHLHDFYVNCLNRKISEWGHLTARNT